MSDNNRCFATRNPGIWPYVARCVLQKHEEGNHKDKYGVEWKAKNEDE